MTIDVTEAAKALELEDPPEILFEPTEGGVGSPAEYDPAVNVIRVDEPYARQVLSYVGPHDDATRIARVHAALERRDMDGWEAMIAHELYHAKQRQNFGSAQALLEAYNRELREKTSGLEGLFYTHDQHSFEAEADAWARDHSNLVKITE